MGACQAVEVFPVIPRGRSLMFVPKGALSISRKLYKAANFNSHKRTVLNIENEITPTHNHSSGSLAKEIQVPWSQSLSLATMEGFMQETNKQLRSVLKHMESCKKQIHTCL